MLAKRKFQNFVGTYGDQFISGKKTFTENLVVTGDCTLPDSVNITLGAFTIPQSSTISTSGWIYDIFTQLIGSVSDLVSDLTNNTFGFLTTTDTISQNQIDQTTENGWISAISTAVASVYAPIINPTFEGTVTFVDTSATPNISTTISDYVLRNDTTLTEPTLDNPTLTGIVTFPDGTQLSPATESTSFWTNRTFYNTVTFTDTTTDPWTSTSITDYLKSASAASTYLTQSSASSTYLTKTSASSTYAPKASPTFTGTVTFPDASTITDYLKSTTASSTYAPKASPTFTGTVTFPDASTITEYLKSTTASSTYAPKASPTFTGTITLNGDVTLASASANTITLNDHLVLCTGSNFTTPVSGQQGYIVSGTNTTDGTTITSASSIDFASINLSYGVWLIIGHLAYTTGVSGTITDKYFWINSQATTQNTTTMVKTRIVFLLELVNL